MKAIDLKQVVVYFDPKEALRGQHLRSWFVERAGTPRARLRIALEAQREPQKILFVGHRGTGKSTELNRLAEEIQGSFHTIGFDALTVTGRSTMRYEDLMLALSTQITRHCIDQNLIGRPATDPLREGWQSLADWWREKVAGFSLGKPGEVNTMASLSTLLGEIEVGVSQSAFTREQLNAFVDREMPELIRRLNWVIGEAEKHLNPKRLLLVVEGLDKVDLDAARHIFRDHAPTILAPHAAMIYTFPLALRYSDDYQTVLSAFNDDKFLSNLSLRHVNSDDDPEGRRALRQIVLSRMESNLVAEDALEQMVMASGGIAVQLVKLVNSAAIYALERSAHATSIELADVRNAIKDLRRELAANLTLTEWRLLKRRHIDRLLSNEAEIQQLLYKGALIEYSNDVQWCDVHPALWGLLDYYVEGDDGGPTTGDH
ncbi:MAG TPA: hypothetical protein PKM78_17160 [Anaerolineae bacterium]|nr:hypothetical protein [Anaerolineae bacterium]HNU05921.1 hypothetical protein [Anaerolineae bacterium]